MKKIQRKFFSLLSFTLLLVLIYSQLESSGLLALMGSVEEFKRWVISYGAVGPVILIAMMALTIVINPIPSAPIALAAGAAYGHTWGTFYVVVGASIGAFVAFGLSRHFGYQFLKKRLGDKIQLGWLGSQNLLTGLVFISRLIPFISFDLVSYGAGLTIIKPWRFMVATIVGLIPASFLLANFGGELTSSNAEMMMLTVLVLGVATLLPWIISQICKTLNCKLFKFMKN